MGYCRMYTPEDIIEFVIDLGMKILYEDMNGLIL